MSIDYNTITSKAEDVLRDVYGDVLDITPPVNLVKIAHQYGLKVYKVRFDGHPNVSGAYNKQKRAIYISDDEGQARKNFTVAHELGHFFLHKNKNSEVFFRTDALNLDQEKPQDEKEADFFASILLMPEALVRRYWQLVETPEELANIFRVSESAMRWRLHNLKLINNYVN